MVRFREKLRLLRNKIIAFFFDGIFHCKSNVTYLNRIGAVVRSAQCPKSSITFFSVRENGFSGRLQDRFIGKLPGRFPPNSCEGRSIDVGSFVSIGIRSNVLVFLVREDLSQILDAKRRFFRIHLPAGGWDAPRGSLRVLASQAK